MLYLNDSNDLPIRILDWHTEDVLVLEIRIRIHLWIKSRVLVDVRDVEHLEEFIYN